MSDTTTIAPPQFRTVCRIGHWLHVDAMWNTEKDMGLTVNYVHFNLANGVGDTAYVGFSIITTDAAGRVVSDENGEAFGDPEMAIRHHAKALLKLEWQWTNWQGAPPMHPSAVDGTSTEVAFSPQDIAHAVKLAATETID